MDPPSPKHVPACALQHKVSSMNTWFAKSDMEDVVCCAQRPDFVLQPEYQLHPRPHTSRKKMGSVRFGCISQSIEDMEHPHKKTHTHSFSIVAIYKLCGTEFIFFFFYKKVLAQPNLQGALCNTVEKHYCAKHTQHCNRMG